MTSEIPPCFQTSPNDTWDANYVGQCGAMFSAEYALDHALGGPQRPQIRVHDGNTAAKRALVHGGYSDVFVHAHPQLLDPTGPLRCVSDSMQARLAGPTRPLDSDGYSGHVTAAASDDPLRHGDGGVHLAPAQATPYVCGGAESVKSTVHAATAARQFDLSKRY